MNADGTERAGLKTWEKLYWGVFVGAASLFLFNRFTGADVVDPDFARERGRRREAARILMGGAATFHDESPFDGMTPREITRFLRSERKRLGLRRGRETDAFEGMDAAEMERHIDGEIHPRDPHHPRFAGMTPDEVSAVLESEKPKKLGALIKEALGFQSKKDKRKAREGAGAEAAGTEGAEGAQGAQGAPEGALAEGAPVPAAPGPPAPGSGGLAALLARTPAEEADEFDGMSPEEIDAALQARAGGGAGGA